MSDRRTLFTHDLEKVWKYKKSLLNLVWFIHSNVNLCVLLCLYTNLKHNLNWNYAAVPSIETHIFYFSSMPIVWSTNSPYDSQSHIMSHMTVHETHSRLMRHTAASWDTQPPYESPSGVPMSHTFVTKKPCTAEPYQRLRRPFIYVYMYPPARLPAFYGPNLHFT